MFSLFNNSQEEIAAVFDIGNGSIGAALVKFSNNKPPFVMYSHREPLTYQPHLNSARLLTTMLKLLKSVAVELDKEGISHLHHAPFMKHRIKNVFCTLSSPWYMSETKVIKIEEPTPFLVTKKLIDDIVKREQKQFSTLIREGKYAQTFSSDVVLLEKKVISTKLNGYEIHNPFNKSTASLEVTLFSSLISQEILTKVQDVIYSAFTYKYVTCHSYALSSFAATRDIYPDIHSFLFMDISAETTEVSVTIHGVLAETISFPLGRSMMLRKLVDAFAVPPEIALSLITTGYSGSMEEQFKQKFNEVMKNAQNEWLIQFYAALSNLNSIYALPQDLFVTVDDDVSHLFMGALESKLPDDIAMRNEKFVIHHLNSDQINAFCQYAVTSKKDPFIGIDSIFARKLIF